MVSVVKQPQTGKRIVYYNCGDCGMVYAHNPSMRPNMKFCDQDCAEYVKHERLAKGGGNDWYNDIEP